MPGLGRLVNHDPRSRSFPAPRTAAPESVLWTHRAPVLDQGELGSCTGNALAQLLNTTKFAKARTASGFGRRYLIEQHAIDLYSSATKLDQFEGEYPPTDTGSSGLGVCKAGVRAGYLQRYEHAFGFDHFLRAMQTQPVIVGTTWYESMFYPNSAGLVTASGRAVGGHEYLALGVDLTGKTVTFLNSWGSGWGRKGRFKIGFRDFENLLLDYGDVTVPISI